MGGRVSTCAMASTCDGLPGNASFQGSYANCSASCTLEYFTFDSTLNTGNNCLCFEQNQCTTAVFLGDQGNNSVLYTLDDVDEPCPAIPFSACDLTNFTCNFDAATFFLGTPASMQECVDEATSANIDILYTFLNVNDGRCYGFTAADCAAGLEPNAGFESAVIQYANPNATCLSKCSDFLPAAYFHKITATVNRAKAGTRPGRRLKYKLTLVPRKVQPSPALLPSLDLNLRISPYLEVKKATLKTTDPALKHAEIDRDADLVTWQNIGGQLFGVGTKKGVPQSLTFTIVAVLAKNAQTAADIGIQAYLSDLNNGICGVLVAETDVLVKTSR